MLETKGTVVLKILSLSKVIEEKPSAGSVRQPLNQEGLIYVIKQVIFLADILYL